MIWAHRNYIRGHEKMANNPVFKFFDNLVCLRSVGGKSSHFPPILDMVYVLCYVDKGVMEKPDVGSRLLESGECKEAC